MIVDVLANRPELFHHSSQVFAHVEKGTIQGIIGAATVTTLSYLLTKKLGQRASLVSIEKLLSLTEVAPVNEAALRAALSAGGKDFEDSVLIASAELVGADGIVTRDVHGFTQSYLPVYAPVEVADFPPGQAENFG